MIMKKSMMATLILSATITLECIIPTAFSASAAELSNGEKLMRLYESERSQEETWVSDDDSALTNELIADYNAILESALVKTTADGIDLYDDTYSGAYIADDKLVVCVTSNMPVAMSDSPNVVYKKVDRSYNELTLVQNELDEKYSNLIDLYNEDTVEGRVLRSIAGYGISCENNDIVVNMVDPNEANKQTFIQLFGEYDCLRFEPADNTTEAYKTFRPGRGIYFLTRIDGSTCYFACLSMGYRAERWNESTSSYVSGFTTCGHGAIDAIPDPNLGRKRVYHSMNIKDDAFGILDVAQFAGSVDASFVSLMSGNTIDCFVEYTEEGYTSHTDALPQDSWAGAMPEGTVVCKCGKTSKKTEGKITNINYSATFNNGVKITKMNLAQLYSAGGDSGAIVYVKDTHDPIGILSGGHDSNGKHYTCYTTALQVASAFKVYPI